MDDSLKSRIDGMLSNYKIIKDKYKWSTDEYTRHFTALIYALNNKEFDLEQLDSMQEFIKENTGMFSHYRSHEKFTLSALLISKFEDPKEAFKKILDLERELSLEGFSKSPHLAIAAFGLLLTCPRELTDKRIRKSREIYKEMKQKHFWLTGYDDYPLAVLLSSGERDTDSIINEIEIYYDLLHKESFSKTNGLQQLSHMLTFSGESTDIKVKRCGEILSYLKGQKIHVYSDHYGLIGLAALSGNNSKTIIDEIIEVYNSIKVQKDFRYMMKQVIFTIACALVCNKYIENVKHNNALLEASLGISLEALIAAETSVMITTIAAASVVTTTTSST